VHVALGDVTLAIVAAVLLVGGLIACTGNDPLEVYRSMVQGSLTGRGLVTTLQQSVPVIGLSLALCFAFRAGVFNLGGDGQLVIGGLAGTVIALWLPGPGVLVILVAFTAAMAAGAVIGAVPALMQTRLDAPVFATSLLLNYPVIALTSYLIKVQLKDPQSSTMATRQVPENVQLGALVPPDSGLGHWLHQTLGSENVLVLIGAGLNWSVAVVFVVLLVTVFAIRRLPIGFEARIIGLNQLFARNVGIDSDRVTILSMMAGGAIAGLVGIMIVLGSHLRLIDGGLNGTGYATTALLVVLLGRSSPGGVVVAGFFFSALTVGGQAMERDFGLSSYISVLMQALVIFLLTLRLSPRWARTARGAT
jgi:simple sugar transport system permease protein